MANAFKRVGEKEVGSTKWLKLTSITYTNAKGEEKLWDMVSRSTKQPNVDADAVCIAAFLYGKDLKEKEILLVRQYRPPAQAHTIELPAGLIDPKETKAEAALRELKEETGYVGKFVKESKGLPLSPGLSNESAAYVFVDVDLDDPANQNPKQRLDADEDIEVFRAPLSQLSSILESHEKKGDLIFHSVYSLAAGINIGIALNVDKKTLLL
eukprot:m.159370 g.159370  ORF g.159370 m.159370 type:complete len:211 (-) comp15150_c0_seq1:447-1079(-)